MRFRPKHESLQQFRVLEECTRILTIFFRLSCSLDLVRYGSIVFTENNWEELWRQLVIETHVYVAVTNARIEHLKGKDT